MCFPPKLYRASYCYWKGWRGQRRWQWWWGWAGRWSSGRESSHRSFCHAEHSHLCTCYCFNLCNFTVPPGQHIVNLPCDITYSCQQSHQSHGYWPSPYSKWLPTNCISWWCCYKCIRQKMQGSNYSLSWFHHLHCTLGAIYIQHSFVVKPVIRLIFVPSLHAKHYKASLSGTPASFHNSSGDTKGCLHS